jgi:hypothetical protein
MKEIDDTPLPQSESELSLEEDVALLRLFVEDDLDHWMKEIERRVANLVVEVADLHHRRRVSRQQATDQDPEWY